MIQESLPSANQKQGSNRFSYARTVASSLLTPKNKSAPLLQRSYYLLQDSVTTHKAQCKEAHSDISVIKNK